jgi:hypothetical protein
MNRAAIKQRLKEHMESSNGKGCWDKYNGSLLEADLVRFVEEELKQGITNPIVMKRYRVSISTQWGSIMIDDVEAENENDAKNKAEEMLLEEIENYSGFDSVDEYD